MTPRIAGTTHWFAEQGLYDGLFLMRDEETGTYWDHMTGEAVYGPLVGERLEVAPVLLSTVAQVLKTWPEARVTLSDRRLWDDDALKVEGLLAGIRGRLNAFFQSTVGSEDTRREQMDLGLGLWTDTEARYYPLDVLRAEGRAIVDRMGGRRILVYIDPSTFVPSALLVEGRDPRWDGDVLRLSDGTYIRDGLAFRSDGSRADAQRPLQVFTRWYGFSLTFPETGVYSAARR